MEKSNLRDLYNSSPNQKAKLIRGVIYSFLNKVFDLAPPVLIGIAIDIVVENQSCKDPCVETSMLFSAENKNIENKIIIISVYIIDLFAILIS